jgi:vacuolar-type H+-ATPase subunit D/Vma8
MGIAEELINDFERINKILKARAEALELENTKLKEEIDQLKEENKKAYQAGFNEGASAAATDIISN